MTEQRRHRPRTGRGVFITDGELVEYLGVPASTAMPMIREFERKDPTFPKKQKVWGDRRYLPAVERWLEANYGLQPRERRYG